MGWITSDDYALFLKDIKDESGNVIHKQGARYSILNEESEVYHVQQKRGTTQVTEFPKDVEGDLFVVE